MARAPLVEVFSSIQGEGRYAGVPMTFVRVAVCPIRCTYCDTPNSYTAASSFPVRTGDHEEWALAVGDRATLCLVQRGEDGVLSLSGSLRGHAS